MIVFNVRSSAVGAKFHFLWYQETQIRILISDFMIFMFPKTGKQCLLGVSIYYKKTKMQVRHLQFTGIKTFISDIHLLIQMPQQNCSFL